MRSSPALVLSALVGLTLASSPAEAAPTTFTTQCEESTGPLTVWAGTTPSGDTYSVKRFDGGSVEKVSVGITTAPEDCLNPQTGDAGLNPQTGDAGIDADIMRDLVVVNVHESGEPIAIIAVFESGMVHVNMQDATAAEANAILVSEGKVDAASAVYAQLPEGDLKTAFASIL